MAFMLHGIGTNESIALGRAFLLPDALSTAVPTVEFSSEEEIEAERVRFLSAVSFADDELAALLGQEETGSDISTFLYMQRMMLSDPMIVEETEGLLCRQRISAEAALQAQMAILEDRFASLDDIYIRQRIQDVRQVVDRLLRVLQNEDMRLSQLPVDEPVIIVAKDLSIPEILKLPMTNVLGFVTEYGGNGSHTLVVANSLGIPALIAVSNALSLIQHRELIVLDCRAQFVILDIDASFFALYHKERASLLEKHQRRQRIRHVPCRTQEGISVGLYANHDVSGHVDAVLDSGAEGIGLLRTELLFMGRKEWPSEDEQFDIYRTLILGLRGAPLTLRTIDFGSDKPWLGGTRLSEANPALGCRGIRLCLQEKELFLTQLCAVLRAANYGPVRILLPMISAQSEVHHFFLLWKEARDRLAERRYMFPDHIPIGMMIEVPSAVLNLRAFMHYFDFASIGSNDLVQYVLAVDRDSEHVFSLYDPLNPAVLKMIAMAVGQCRQMGKRISLCGEMAGDVALTRLLLGMGLREFSMHPSRVLPVYECVLGVRLATIQPTVRALLKEFNAYRILEHLEKINAL